MSCQQSPVLGEMDPISNQPSRPTVTQIQATSSPSSSLRPVREPRHEARAWKGLFPAQASHGRAPRLQTRTGSSCVGQARPLRTAIPAVSLGARSDRGHAARLPHSTRASGDDEMVASLTARFTRGEAVNTGEQTHRRWLFTSLGRPMSKSPPSSHAVPQRVEPPAATGTSAPLPQIAVGALAASLVKQDEVRAGLGKLVK